MHDFKIRRARSASSIWNHKSIISDQNSTTWSSITTLFTAILKYGVEFSLYQFIWPSSRFAEKRKQKGFYISFCTRKGNNAIWSENGAIQNRNNDLEQMWLKKKKKKKKKWCESWINHTAESQSDCRDHQWFQSGYEKESHIPTRVSHKESSDLREDLKLTPFSRFPVNETLPFQS